MSNRNKLGFIAIALITLLSCKKDAVQHTCAVNVATLGTSTYNYTYDGQGRVVSVSGASTATITYGSNNTMAMTTNNNGTQETAVGTLNSSGNLLTLNSPSYTYQMTYDNNNRLLSLYATAGSSGSETISYTYNTNGDVMAINVSTSTGTSLSINVNDWDTNANVGQFEPIFLPNQSLYKFYGKFSNHLPKAFNYNGTNYTLTYVLNSNGYIDSMTSTGGGSTTNYAFTMTCN